MPASLDTNLLLRLSLRDIPTQYEAVRDLVAAPGARYRVTDAAINEAVHALSYHYQMSRHQVAEIVRAIIWDGAIDASSGFLDAVLTTFETHNALSYTDCYLAEEARNSGNTPLLTFAKKLASGHETAQLHRTAEKMQ